MDDSLKSLLADGAAQMGVALDERALTRFSVYVGLLQRWGRKINLTTRLRSEEAVVYHFLDSLSGAPLLAGTPDGRVVDLGAGAGFPSLPLKFALPNLRLVLIESIRKKVAFCEEVVRAAGVPGVEVVWGRGEDVGTMPGRRGSFDWAVSRALGPAAEVAALALPFLAPGGRVLLYKGEPEPAELDALDLFCAANGGKRELLRVTVPHLTGSRSLITVGFPDVPPKRL